VAAQTLDALVQGSPLISRAVTRVGGSSGLRAVALDGTSEPAARARCAR